MYSEEHLPYGHCTCLQYWSCKQMYDWQGFISSGLNDKFSMLSFHP